MKVLTFAVIALLLVSSVAAAVGIRELFKALDPKDNLVRGALRFFKRTEASTPDNLSWINDTANNTILTNNSSD